MYQENEKEREMPFWAYILAGACVFAFVYFNINGDRVDSFVRDFARKLGLEKQVEIVEAEEDDISELNSDMRGKWEIKTEKLQQENCYIV